MAALDAREGIGDTVNAWKRAAEPLSGLRFHGLRHQAITELAELGAPDATLMALAGHLSRSIGHRMRLPTLS